MKKFFRFIFWSAIWTAICYIFVLILGGANFLLFPRQVHIVFVCIGVGSGFVFSKYYESK